MIARDMSGVQGHGSLDDGVARVDDAGRRIRRYRSRQKKPRKVLRHRIPASLMPILAHPFVYRDALYFESTGLHQAARKLVRFVGR